MAGFSVTEPRVALEVSTLCERHRTGTGRYALSLLAALDQRTDLPPAKLLYRLSRWRRRHLRHAPERSRWYVEGLPPPLGLGCSVVHGTDLRVPGWRGLARVATLHDVFHVLPFSSGWASEAFRVRSRTMYARLARDAEWIISVSAASRADFLAAYDFPAERITVIPHGVDAAFVPQTATVLAELRQRLDLTRPYVLHVGALAIRKNLPRLIRSFAAGLSGSHDLLLAGPAADDLPAIHAAIATAGLERSVRFLNYVADADLPALYAGAALLAMPSFYEGFGLPVLEAMACGTPVLTADRGGTAEIAGGHALLVDPHDDQALTEILRRAAVMPAAQRTAARAHAAAFTWAAAAEATVTVYRKALDLHRG